MGKVATEEKRIVVRSIADGDVENVFDTYAAAEACIAGREDLVIDVNLSTPDPLREVVLLVRSAGYLDDARCLSDMFADPQFWLALCRAKGWGDDQRRFITAHYAYRVLWDGYSLRDYLSEIL